MKFIIAGFIFLVGAQRVQGATLEEAYSAGFRDGQNQVKTITSFQCKCEITSEFYGDVVKFTYYNDSTRERTVIRTHVKRSAWVLFSESCEGMAKSCDY